MATSPQPHASDLKWRVIGQHFTPGDGPDYLNSASAPSWNEDRTEYVIVDGLSLKTFRPSASLVRYFTFVDGDIDAAGSTDIPDSRKPVSACYLPAAAVPAPYVTGFLILTPSGFFPFYTLPDRLLCPDPSLIHAPSAATAGVTFGARPQSPTTNPVLADPSQRRRDIPIPAREELIAPAEGFVGPRCIAITPPVTAPVLTHPHPAPSPYPSAFAWYADLVRQRRAIAEGASSATAEGPHSRPVTTSAHPTAAAATTSASASPSPSPSVARARTAVLGATSATATPTPSGTNPLSVSQSAAALHSLPPIMAQSTTNTPASPPTVTTAWAQYEAAPPSAAAAAAVAAYPGIAAGTAAAAAAAAGSRSTVGTCVGGDLTARVLPPPPPPRVSNLLVVVADTDAHAVVVLEGWWWAETFDDAGVMAPWSSAAGADGGAGGAAGASGRSVGTWRWMAKYSIGTDATPANGWAVGATAAPSTADVAIHPPLSGSLPAPQYGNGVGSVANASFIAGASFMSGGTVGGAGSARYRRALARVLLPHAPPQWAAAVVIAGTPPAPRQRPPLTHAMAVAGPPSPTAASKHDGAAAAGGQHERSPGGRGGNDALSQASATAPPIDACGGALLFGPGDKAADPVADERRYPASAGVPRTPPVARAVDLSHPPMTPAVGECAAGAAAAGVGVGGGDGDGTVGGSVEEHASDARAGGDPVAASVAALAASVSCIAGIAGGATDSDAHLAAGGGGSRGPDGADDGASYADAYAKDDETSGLGAEPAGTAGGDGCGGAAAVGPQASPPSAAGGDGDPKASIAAADARAPLAGDANRDAKYGGRNPAAPPAAAAASVAPPDGDADALYRAASSSAITGTTRPPPAADGTAVAGTAAPPRPAYVPLPQEARGLFVHPVHIAIPPPTAPAALRGVMYVSDPTAGRVLVVRVDGLVVGVVGGPPAHAGVSGGSDAVAVHVADYATDWYAHHPHHAAVAAALPVAISDAGASAARGASQSGGSTTGGGGVDITGTVAVAPSALPPPLPSLARPLATVVDDKGTIIICGHTGTRSGSGPSAGPVSGTFALGALMVYVLPSDVLATITADAPPTIPPAAGGGGGASDATHPTLPPLSARGSAVAASPCAAPTAPHSPRAMPVSAAASPVATVTSPRGRGDGDRSALGLPVAPSRPTITRPLRYSLWAAFGLRDPPPPRDGGRDGEAAASTATAARWAADLRASMPTVAYGGRVGDIVDPVGSLVTDDGRVIIMERSRCRIVVVATAAYRDPGAVSALARAAAVPPAATLSPTTVVGRDATSPTDEPVQSSSPSKSAVSLTSGNAAAALVAALSTSDTRPDTRCIKCNLRYCSMGGKVSYLQIGYIPRACAYDGQMHEWRNV